MRTTQRSLRGIGIAVIATSLVVVPGSLAATRHHRHALPNLTVSGGSIRLSSGRIVGSFTVRNVGRARADRSQAELSMTVGRRHPRLGTFSVHGLTAGARAKVAVSVRVPSGTPAGSYLVLACADATQKVNESSASDNCTRVGRLRFSSPSAPPGTPTTPIAMTPTGTTPITTTPFTPTEPQPGPTQIPSDPITISPDTPTLVDDSYAGETGSYYVATPPKYDATGNTPMRLLVWMHGCGGEAKGDTYEMIASNKLDAHGETQDDDNRDFIVISIGGTDEGCWDPNTDVIKVLMAVADVTTHFNIDRRHIFIAGYSSGGDLAYRTIFYNADEFAGILAVNTNPFRDTGSTEAQSMAAAAWKFNIAQVAHSEDTEYHPDACTACLEGADDPGVTPAMNDLRSAGYNVQYVIKPGTHSDEDDFVNHTGTDYDFRQYVLPFIDNPAWESPGS
jgi:predicted esterase